MIYPSVDNSVLLKCTENTYKYNNQTECSKKIIKCLEEIPCEMLQIEKTRNGIKRHGNHRQNLLDLILKTFKFHRHENLILCWWLRRLVSSFNIWFNTLQI